MKSEAADKKTATTATLCFNYTQQPPPLFTLLEKEEELSYATAEKLGL